MACRSACWLAPRPGGPTYQLWSCASHPVASGRHSRLGDECQINLSVQATAAALALRVFLDELLGLCPCPKQMVVEQVAAAVVEFLGDDVWALALEAVPDVRPDAFCSGAVLAMSFGALVPPENFDIQLVRL